MDTRYKILTLEQAASAIDQSGKLTAIVGHFDPMTASHARRIAGLLVKTDRIVVIVTDPPQPVLALRARLELVAALQAVDYVVAAMHNTSAEIIAGLQPDEVIQEESADVNRTQDLIAHVHRRQVAKEK
ncbi:MAG: hypothetical protein ABJF23_28925 [Bryobacteraceae bacterium]